jgi:hypothetical protein
MHICIQDDKIKATEKVMCFSPKMLNFVHLLICLIFIEYLPYEGIVVDAGDKKGEKVKQRGQGPYIS